MSREPYTVDLAAVGFQAESGLPAMSAPGESLTVTTRCDRLIAFSPCRAGGRVGTVPPMRTQTGDVAGTLDTMGPGTGQAEKGAVVYPDLADRVGLPPRSALERGDVPLPPVECERLQGFPDGWTDVPGVKCPDSRRYAAMGNAVTVNVAEYIGRRILAEHKATLAE